jgi:hypothetical protein
MESMVKLAIGRAESILAERVESIKAVMVEREKASINAAQALITKDGQEQMSKFVLKQELNDRIERLQEQLTGPLGLELRMRIVEQESHGSAEREKRISALELQKGSFDAKLYMIIVGMSALITAVMTAILHVLFKA